MTGRGDDTAERPILLIFICLTCYYDMTTNVREGEEETIWVGGVIRDGWVRLDMVGRVGEEGGGG